MADPGVPMLRRLVPIVLALGLAAAACGPAVPGAPPGVYRGDECAWSAEIQDVWAGTGDEHWAVDTAIRESGCNPCAFYPSRSDCGANPSTARGMFQLLGHYGLEQAARGHGACPLDGRWSDPWCGMIAAKFLYDGSGRAPWRL